MAAPVQNKDSQSPNSMPASAAAGSPLINVGQMIGGQKASANHGANSTAAAAGASGAMQSVYASASAAQITKHVTKAAQIAEEREDIDALSAFTGVLDPKSEQQFMQMVVARRALHKGSSKKSPKGSPTVSPHRSPTGSPKVLHRAIGLKVHKPSTHATTSESAASAPASVPASVPGDSQN